MPQKPTVQPSPLLAPPRSPAAHVLAAVARAAQAKMPIQAKAPGSPHVQAAIARAVPAKLGSAAPARPTLRPASSKAAIQLSSSSSAAAVPPPPDAIEPQGGWGRRNYRDHVTGDATFRDTARVTIFGVEYDLVVLGSAQKHDDLTSADAVVAALNADRGSFSTALNNAGVGNIGSVRLGGSEVCSIKFSVEAGVARPRLTIFHAQRTADMKGFFSARGTADKAKSWRT